MKELQQRKRRLTKRNIRRRKSARKKKNAGRTNVWNRKSVP
ncbi:MAG: hypothetical protein ACLVAW_00115 [Eisenbergiella massiliensis]